MSWWNFFVGILTVYFLGGLCFIGWIAYVMGSESVLDDKGKPVPQYIIYFATIIWPITLTKVLMYKGHDD